MEEIISQLGTNQFQCKICNKNLKSGSVYKHIKNNTHRTLTTSKVDDPVKLITKSQQINANRMNQESTERSKNDKDYMEFLAYMMRKNISFRQISTVGTFIRKMIEQKKTSIFLGYFFDEEEISKVHAALELA